MGLIAAIAQTEKRIDELTDTLPESEYSPGNEHHRLKPGERLPLAKKRFLFDNKDGAKDIGFGGNRANTPPGRILVNVMDSAGKNPIQELRAFGRWRWWN